MILGEQQYVGGGIYHLPHSVVDYSWKKSLPSSERQSSALHIPSTGIQQRQRSARGNPATPPLSNREFYLVVGALLEGCLSGLQLALQGAVVSILLVDLLPVRVHLHYQLRVALLQAAPRRVRALHLRLRLGQLVQQAAVPVGHCPVVERQYGDDHHQEDEDKGREAASPSVCTEPHHIRKWVCVSFTRDC